MQGLNGLLRLPGRLHYFQLRQVLVRFIPEEKLLRALCIWSMVRYGSRAVCAHFYREALAWSYTHPLHGNSHKLLGFIVQHCRYGHLVEAVTHGKGPLAKNCGTLRRGDSGR